MKLERRTVLLVAVILVLFSSYIIGNIFWINSGIESSSEYKNNVLDNYNAETIGFSFLILALVIYIIAVIYLGNRDKSIAKLFGGVLAAALGRVIINMTIFTHTWVYWIPFLLFCVVGLFLVKKKDLKYNQLGTAFGLGIFAVVFAFVFWIIPNMSNHMNDLFNHKVDWNFAFPEKSINYIFENSGWFVLIILFSSLFLILLIPQLRKLFAGSKEEVDTSSKEMEEEISESVENAIADLKKRKDIESSVIRCYQKMCLILNEHGMRYDKHMTPREFQNYSIENLSLSKEIISNITKTFEKARYGSKSMDESDRALALQNLKKFRKEIQS